MDSYAAVSVPSMGHGRRGGMMGMAASSGERLLLADAGGQNVADSQGRTSWRLVFA